MNNIKLVTFDYPRYVDQKRSYPQTFWISQYRNLVKPACLRVSVFQSPSKKVNLMPSPPQFSDQPGEITLPPPIGNIAIKDEGNSQFPCPVLRFQLSSASPDGAYKRESSTTRKTHGTMNLTPEYFFTIYYDNLLDATAFAWPLIAIIKREKRDTEYTGASGKMIVSRVTSLSQE
jgi:hypothetical protein